MANPNPSPSTRFGASEGNSPRAKQKGARDRLSAAFLDDFAAERLFAMSVTKIRRLMQASSHRRFQRK
jgi:hypothetical protein